MEKEAAFMASKSMPRMMSLLPISPLNIFLMEVFD
jgi:hypothetical protein